MSSICPLLERVHIISARTTYEKTLGSNLPSSWKKAAFTQCIAGLGCCEKNILAFGDSMAERDAVLSCGREIPNCRVKNVKVRFCCLSLCCILFIVLGFSSVC